MKIRNVNGGVTGTMSNLAELAYLLQHVTIYLALCYGMLSIAKDRERVVLITGASAGLGRATAREFAKKGGDVPWFVPDSVRA